MSDNIHFHIKGGYQYDAIHHGICFQKSWHLLKYKRALELLEVNEHDVILDAACGSGVLTNLVAERNPASVTGVDFSEAAIAFCKHKYSNARLDFQTVDLQQRCFEANSFSKIIMLEVLEHLTE